MVVRETCLAANAVCLGNVLHVTQHETDKAVALAPYSIHNRASIDADNAIDMDAKPRRLPDGMRGLGGGNQKLARHAADARAGAAIVAAFDNYRTHSCSLGCVIRDKARGAGTDHCNVNLNGLHASPSFHR
jgi:hypothetical protein